MLCLMVLTMDRTREEWEEDDVASSWTGPLGPFKGGRETLADKQSHGKRPSFPPRRGRALPSAMGSFYWPGAAATDRRADHSNGPDIATHEWIGCGAGKADST